MSKSHTCINTAGGMIPPPCEACAEMPRCPHGARVGMDRCDSCALNEVRTALRLLLAASGRVALYQPAGHATTQAEADNWGAFYSAIVYAGKVPLHDGDAGGRLARRPWGIFDKAGGHWWPRGFKTPEEAQAHLDACVGPERATSEIGTLFSDSDGVGVLSKVG